MFSLVEKRRYYFLLSAAFIVPGLLIMIYSTITTGAPFRLGIDFVGGSIYEITFTQEGATESLIRDVFTTFGDENALIQRLGGSESLRWSVRSAIQDPTVVDQVVSNLESITPIDRDLFRNESVSATIGQEVTRAAIFAILMAATVIIGFIIIAFRQVPNALRYGVCAISAMAHDVLIVCSVMSLAGLLLGWEADALFLTAILTIVGFSIQDTIVVFDRIRENIPRYLGEPYETIVNRSILETIHRSLATQLNAFFIMATILLFGGDTIKQFIAILFIGLLSGTYSSIFTAVPMLVAWEKGELPLISSTELSEERA